MIGAVTATVAATVLTLSSGSRSVALDVVQDDHDVVAGAGQGLPASEVESNIRLESGEVEV